MTAVDSNVLVRFLTRDDAYQSGRARFLIENEEVWIAKTVLLEAEWVLRSAYRFQSEDVRSAFRGLIGLPTVEIEDETAVIEALRLGDEGLDFADALHLVSRPQDAAFRSFDEVLVRRAQRAGVPNVHLAGRSSVS